MSDPATDDPFAAFPKAIAGASSAAPEADDPNDPFAAFPKAIAAPTSATGAFGRSAARGTAPAAGGLAAAGVGAETFGAIGTAVGGPVGGVVGGFAGGVAGMIAGGAAVAKAQDWALSKLPDSWREKIGMSDRQAQLDETDHPIASFLGGVAPYALTMSPLAVAKKTLPENATALQRIMANPKTARLFGGTAMGGMELGQEAVEDPQISWPKVAISTGFGVVFNKPTRVGEAITGAAPNLARRAFGRAPAPTIAQAADVKVMGAGVTEPVFMGSQEQAPVAAMTAQETARAEQSLVGPPAVSSDIHDAARQMHSELFARYDELKAQRDTFAGWVKEAGPDEAPVAAKHLAAIEFEMRQLDPDVGAAYRRAAESTGATTIEAPPAPKQFSSMAEMLAARGEPAGQPGTVDSTHDVKSGAVSSKDKPGVTYVDPRIPEFSPILKDKDGNPANLHKYLAIHEQTERTAMANGESYLDAHSNKATPAERTAVEADGVDWKKYTEEMDGYLDKIEHEKVTNPPPDPHVDPAAAVGHHQSENKAAAPASAPIDQRAYIADDVEKQLVAAGRSKEEARASAQIIATAYETRAARFKGALGTAQELYDREGAEIHGPGYRAPRTAQARPGGPAAKPESTWSLLEFIASRGGIDADDPLIADVRGSMGGNNKFIPGFGNLIRRGGMGLDKAREAAVHAGYLFDVGDVTGGESKTDVRTLLDALDQEMRGERVYARNYAPEAAIDEDQQEHMREGALAQGARGKIRPMTGATSISATSTLDRPIITLMKDANASTFIHESGHDFLEQMMRDADHPAAPDDLKGDAQIVRTWLGVKSSADIKTRQHEKFARGFEQYLREGVAPSKELASVFAKFKQWLVAIYQTLKGLGEPISEDIKGVFDRMLVSEPQRTVIAPERAAGPTMAEIHESDAALTEAHEAEPQGDLVIGEAYRHITEPPPEVTHDIPPALAEVKAARAAAQPAGQADGGTGASGHLESGSGTPEPVTDIGGVGEGRGAELRGGGNALPEGAGASGRAGEPAGSTAGEAAQSHPLGPTPAKVFGSRESPFVDKAGNIRVENLTSREDVAQAIHDAADANDNFIGDRRGVVTDGQVLDLAEALGMDAAKLNTRKIGQAFNAEQIVAARQLLIQSATDVAELMKRAADGDDHDVMAYAEAKDRHQMIQAQVAGITAEAGRALRAFRTLAGQEDVQGVDQFIRAATGKTLFQLKEEAKLGSALKTPEQVSKFTADALAGKRTFGRMILEYWINGLISGPATHTTYMVGNTILSLEKVGPETALAALIGRMRTAMGRQGETVRMGEVGAQLRGGRAGMAPALKAAAEAFRTGVTTLLPGEGTNQATLPFQPGSELARPAELDEAARYHDAFGAAFGIVRGLRDGILAGGALLKAGGVEGSPLIGLRHSQLGLIPDITVRGVNVSNALTVASMAVTGGIPIPFGGTAVRLPGRFIAGIHSFFRSVNYSMAKAGGAYRAAANEGLAGTAFDARVADIRQNPSESQMEEWRSSATDLTLMGKGSPFVQALSRLTNTEILGFPILKFIDPFVHIAGNIIDQSIVQRTPLGLLAPEIRADLMGRNGNIAQDMATARMLAGTGIAVAFGSLAAEGLISGSGPSDPKQSAVWRLAGNQAHSIRINDTWYAVNKLGPMGMLLGLSADMYDVAHTAESGEYLQAASMLQHAVTQNILDESFMRGPAELIQALEDPGRYGEAYLKNFLSSFVPYSVAMSQIDRATDPYARQARTVLDAIKQKVPGLSEQLLPRRDIWGEEIPNMEALGHAGVTAIYERRMSADPVNLAMLNLGIYPAQLARKIRNVELTDDQYDEFSRIAGRMSKQRLDAIVRSADYQTWPNHIRHDVIAETITQSREAARGILMMKYPSIPHDATQIKLDKMQGQDK